MVYEQNEELNKETNYRKEPNIKTEAAKYEMEVKVHERGSKAHVAGSKKNQQT